MWIEVTRKYTGEPLYIMKDHILAFEDGMIVMNTAVKGHIMISVKETAQDIIERMG